MADLSQHARDSKELRRLCQERDDLKAKLHILQRRQDRIRQLCTYTHESKEAFCHRVQSVLEWNGEYPDG